MPTLRQLEYLVAIADAKHFGRAAASANVSQPTLSQQIRTLEARLGATLVERGESPVELTPVGRDIAQRAREVLLRVEDIGAFARRSVAGIAGTIRFGVTPTIGPYLMPEVIAQLHSVHPDMRLYIREGIPDDQLAELRRGALDMMLAPLPITDSRFHVEPLFTEPLHFIAACDHSLCSKDQQSRDDLAGQEVLSLDPRHHFHRQVTTICADLNAILLRDYEGTSLDSLRQMAGSGLGLAILPELYLRSEPDGLGLVRKLRIKGWSATRGIAAVWRKGAAYSESYAMIAEAIAKEAMVALAHSNRS